MQHAGDAECAGRKHGADRRIAAQADHQIGPSVSQQPPRAEATDDQPPEVAKPLHRRTGDQTAAREHDDLVGIEVADVCQGTIVTPQLDRCAAGDQALSNRERREDMTGRSARGEHDAIGGR